MSIRRELARGHCCGVAEKERGGSEEAVHPAGDGGEVATS